MKKIVLFALAACAIYSAKAEDIYQIVPVKTHPASSVAAENRMDVILTRDTYTNNTGCQFDIVVPAGMTITKFAAVSTGIVPSHKEAELDDDDEPTGNMLTVYDLSHTLASMGSNTYRCMVVDAKATGASLKEAQSGVIGRLTFKTTASMAPGVYPIILKSTELTDGATGSAIRFGTVVSYVVVGDNVEGKTLVAEGTIPSKVSEALATETAISTLDLSAVTAINGDFTYADSRNVVAPADVTTSVKYEGNKPGYYSVNVPFAGDVTGEVYEFASASGGYAHFDKVTTVEANKTYLAQGKVTIAANAKVVGVAEKTGQTGNYVLDDTFYHGSNLTVPATRGLFEGASLSNLRVVVDGELTGINMAQIEAGEASYDLQGRQTTNTKNGVFVVNGKKQFVK